MIVAQSPVRRSRASALRLGWIAAAAIALPGLGVGGSWSRARAVEPPPAEAPSTEAPSSETPPTAPVLRLASGDHVAGRLVDSSTPGEVVWESPNFTAPLVFSTNVVSSIAFPAKANAAAPPAGFRFELAGGDIVLGDLVTWNDEQVEIDALGLGRLRIDPAALRRVVRAIGEEWLFVGPNGLAGWNVFGPAGGWREESGQLVAPSRAPACGATFGLPAQACFEIELSWDKSASERTVDFELALGGVGPEPQSVAHAFRLSVVGKSAVVVRETSLQADIVKLQELPPDSAGRLHLLLFVDQDRGRMLVYSAEDQLRADLNVENEPERNRIVGVVNEETTYTHSAKINSVQTKGAAVPMIDGNRLRIVGKKIGVSQIKLNDEHGRWQTLNVFIYDRAPRPGHGGVQLINNSGNLRLERLTIRRWDGDPAPLVGASALAQAGNGAIARGRVVSYDADSRQFVVEAEGGVPRRLDATRDVDIRLPAPETGRPGSLTLVHVAGHRVSGELLKVEQGAVWLKCKQLGDPLSVRAGDLVSLLAAEPTAAGPDIAGRVGRLELDGVSLRGWLTDGGEAEGGALVWQPNLSRAASPLVGGIAGRIVYHDPPAPTQTVAPPAKQQPFGVVQNALRTLFPTAKGSPAAVAPAGDAVLHLRRGDSFSATVERIDERGVTFHSKSIDATFVPHEQLQAIELRVATAPIKIAKPKKDRLLTLPRMQRDNPPTQLVRGVNGDYLRGRLVAMDDKELRLEVRLEERILPREHRPADLAASRAGGPSVPARRRSGGRRARVQTVPASSGRGAASRLTFRAHRFENPNLSGISELLGPCRVDVHDVDQILIGPAIDRAASSLTFHQWTLKPAAEPRGTESGPDAGEGDEGLASALVGKPAPEMELKLVDGEKFRVADYKQKVLVLDFWASWCGPCLQAMPQVERVAREFADQDVRLVGINLQEDADRVRATLERLRLDMQVALDSEGRMAERYAATAIPQTVIIDREGKVARLFVGGGARFDEQLREALRGVLAAPAAKVEPSE